MTASKMTDQGSDDAESLTGPPSTPSGWQGRSVSTHPLRLSEFKTARLSAPPLSPASQLSSQVRPIVTAVLWTVQGVFSAESLVVTLSVQAR